MPRVPLLILLVAASTSLFPFFGLALYAFPAADDYCLAVEAAGQGLWQAQSFFYSSWTGRYTAMGAQLLLSQWDLASVYPWFCLATVTATLFAFHVVIGAVWRHDAPGRLLHATAAAVATAVFLGRLPSPTEALFWMSSAIAYQWGIIAYLLWLSVLLRLAHTGGAPRSVPALRVIAVVLTVLVPGFNEILAPTVLLTLAGIIAARRLRQSSTDPFLVSLLLVAVMCTAASLLAPGNAVRSESYPQLASRHDLAFALGETVRRTASFLGEAGSQAALWATAFAAWWWGPRRRSAWIRRSPAWLSAAWTVGLVALVSSTIFPLYWEYGEVNYTGEGRTFNVTYFVFAAALAAGVSSVLDSTWVRLKARGLRLAATRTPADFLLAITLAALMVGASGVQQSFRELREAPGYLATQQRRDALLRAPENEGRAVVVQALHIRPSVLFWGDLEPDETHWINRCVADYHPVRSVRTP